MLRVVIWLLVLANTAYFAWSQGYLAPMGFAPTEQREPQRLQAEVNPDTLRLLNAPSVQPSAQRSEQATATAPAPAATTTPAPTEVATTPAPDSVPPVAAPTAAAPTPTPTPAPAPAVVAEGKKTCWQADGLTEPQAESLRAALALQDVPVRWQLVEFRNGGRWIVYMGRYDNTEQLERKKTELRGLKVEFREVTAPGLSPGLALGTYSSEEAAEKALKDLARSGVRTAQVAQDRAESVSFTLKLPSASQDQRDAISTLIGKPLQACK